MAAGRSKSGNWPGGRPNGERHRRNPSRDRLRTAPFRPAEFLSIDLDLREDTDGVIRLTTNRPFEPIDANLARAFLAMAARKGDAPALAERGPDGTWSYTSFADLARQVEGASQWLLDNLPRGGVLVVMAENSVAVAALSFAAFATGTILCPISPAYGAAGGDHARLRHVFAKVRPAAILLESLSGYAKAMAEVGNTATVIARDPAVFEPGAVALADGLATVPTAAVEKAVAAIDPTATAQYMMTSGATGLPKWSSIRSMLWPPIPRRVSA